MVDDDANDAEAAKPRRWNDYTVKFEFPEPLDTNDAALLQLIDADFQYPGRKDFGMHGMNVGIGMGSRVRTQLFVGVLSSNLLAQQDCIRRFIPVACMSMECHCLCGTVHSCQILTVQRLHAADAHLRPCRSASWGQTVLASPR